MNCLHCEELMSEYVEKTLDAAERSTMDLHLHVCDDCRALLASVREVLAWGRSFPAFEPPPWLATRIIANTPRVARESWTDTLASVWKWIIEPRTAMAIFTAVLVIGWLGNLAGISPDWSTVVRNPSSIYYGAQGTLNRAYDEAVRRYYRSPLVTEIRTRIEQLREIS